MRKNIYDSISELMELLALSPSAQSITRALRGGAVCDIDELGAGNLVEDAELIAFSVRGQRHTFRLSRKGQQGVAPGIVLEYAPEVSFDFERRGNGELVFRNIKGLKVTTKLGPIKFASTEMKRVTYKPPCAGVTGIDATMGVRFGLQIPAKFRLDADWKFAGLGC